VIKKALIPMFLMALLLLGSAPFLYANINLNQNEVTNTHTQTAADAPLLTSNNTAWRENVQLNSG